jgi:hypothetical protein
MWAEDSESFGARFVFPEDDSPWVARPHLLQEDDDLKRLRDVDYVYGGIHGRMLEYYRQMKDMASDYTVRFRDGMIINGTELVYMGGGGIIGPTRRRIYEAQNIYGRDSRGASCPALSRDTGKGDERNPSGHSG